MLKKILPGLVVVLVLIQFIRPEPNLSDDQTHNIALKYPVPADVKQILEVACNDCHSNKTGYPWYSKVQPMGWWLANHVNEGKRELNFSTFTRMPVAVQKHKLDETIEMIEDKQMPLASYTFLGLHKGADLTDAQREILVKWAEQQITTLKATYPADSLKMKRRPPAPVEG